MKSNVTKYVIQNIFWHKPNIDKPNDSYEVHNVYFNLKKESQGYLQ